MKLNMWIVHDWLSDYQTEAMIKEGKQTINGIRYLSDDLDLSPDYLYVGYREQYIDQGDYNVICVNSTDIVLLNAPDIYEIFNEMQHMLEYYNDWETKILQGINEHSELSYFLELTAPVLKSNLAISDISHKVLAHAAYDDAPEKTSLVNGFLEPDVIRFVNRQYQMHLKEHAPYFIDSSKELDMIYNLFSGDDRLIATIIALGGGEGNRVHSRMQLMDTFGKMMNLWFLIHEKEFTHSALFQDILEERETDPAQIALRMDGMGWSGNPEMQLFIMRSCVSNILSSSYIARYLELNCFGAETVEYNDDLLVIVNFNLADRSDFLEDLKALLQRQEAYCGCSRSFRLADHLKSNYQQAVFAAEYGEQSAGAVNFSEDYALDYMKTQFQKSNDLDMASPFIEVLKLHDQKNGTDYYHTLYTYLLCERNQTLSAKRLFIHRNSLVYRISRIEELIPVDLEDEKQRLYLLLSFIAKEEESR